MGNVEIGSKAAQFHFWEYIIWIMFAVRKKVGTQRPIAQFYLIVGVQTLAQLKGYSSILGNTRTAPDSSQHFFSFLTVCV